MNLKSQPLFKSVPLTDPFEQLKLQYLVTFDAKYASIKKALHDENHAALLFVVHQLAGSAGSYGFDDISACCLTLEKQLQQSETFDKQTIDTGQQLLSLITQAKA